MLRKHGSPAELHADCGHHLRHAHVRHIVRGPGLVLGAEGAPRHWAFSWGWECVTGQTRLDVVRGSGRGVWMWRCSCPERIPENVRFPSRQPSSASAAGRSLHPLHGCTALKPQACARRWAVPCFHVAITALQAPHPAVHAAADVVEAQLCSMGAACATDRVYLSAWPCRPNLAHLLALAGTPSTRQCVSPDCQPGAEGPCKEPLA